MCFLQHIEEQNYTYRYFFFEKNIWFFENIIYLCEDFSESSNKLRLFQKK